MTAPGGPAAVARRSVLAGSLRRLFAPIAIAWAAAPGALVLVGLITAAQGAIPVALAWLTKIVLDEVVTPGTGAVWWAVGGLVCVTAAAAVLPHAGDHGQAVLRRGVELTVQVRLFAAVSRTPGLGPFEQPAFHDRLQLAEQAGQTGPGQVVTGVAGLGQGAITLVGLIGSLVAVDPLLAAAALVVGVPALLAELKLSRARAGLTWQLSPLRRQAMHYALMQGDLQAAKEIRIFQLADFLVGRMADLIRRAHRQEHALDRRELRIQTVLGAASAAALAAALALAIARAVRGELSVGALALVLAALPAVQSSVAAVVRGTAEMHEALILFDHYREMVSAPPPPRGEAVGRITGEIELDDVWFRYGEDQPWVLRGVNLTIPRGRTVALVGVNGAGKSTVVKLLCRFYEPVRGAIRWDGMDLRRVDHAALRRRISAVFQDFVVYDLTAAENIGVGNLDRIDDLSAIRRAASHAGVDDAITALPLGYDTLLSRIFTGGLPLGDGQEGGVLLSGGQWQRMAIARALLRDECDLLILDEPNSGLDPEAEYQLQQRLHRLGSGRTTLLISHRLSTVRRADHIVVLDGGVVAATGTHDELVARDGLYARLFRRQAAGYQHAGPAEVSAEPGVPSG